jgi:hypothetical protein
MHNRCNTKSMTWVSENREWMCVSRRFAIASSLLHTCIVYWINCNRSVKTDWLQKTGGHWRQVIVVSSWCCNFYFFCLKLLCRAHSVFTITVEQKERQSSKIGVRANIVIAELAGYKYFCSFFSLLMCCSVPVNACSFMYYWFVCLVLSSPWKSRKRCGMFKKNVIKCYFIAQEVLLLKKRKKEKQEML